MCETKENVDFNITRFRIILTIFDIKRRNQKRVFTIHERFCLIVSLTKVRNDERNARYV